SMRQLLFLILFFILFGCAEKRQDILSKDDTIQMIFNKNEIVDLSEILIFFEQSIGLSENYTDDEFQKAYSDFFSLNKEIGMSSELRFSFDYSDTMNLLGKIDTLTMNEIWENKLVRTKMSKDSTYVFKINFNGKYMKFLQRLGEQNRKIENYYNTIKVASDITPALVADIALNYKDYNIYDPKVRLVIAIHYLTLNVKLNRI
ncbi:MAG: hypothetical protein JW842_07520, partial [Prolixibacteraceae bacterium]|nr:hypothetical protein [Prolixibacteraceae bacterium]